MMDCVWSLCLEQTSLFLNWSLPIVYYFNRWQESPCLNFFFSSYALEHWFTCLLFGKTELFRFYHSITIITLSVQHETNIYAVFCRDIQYQCVKVLLSASEIVVKLVWKKLDNHLQWRHIIYSEKKERRSARIRWAKLIFVLFECMKKYFNNWNRIYYFTISGSPQTYLLRAWKVDLLLNFSYLSFKQRFGVYAPCLTLLLSV